MSQSVNMIAWIPDWKLKYWLVDSFQITINYNTFIVDHTVDFHDFYFEFKSGKSLVTNVGFF